MNTPNNRRFRDTATAIQAAFLHMFDTETHARISVRAICEAACVNRSTFYAHYQGIPDLLERIEEEMDAQIVAEYHRRGIDQRRILSPRHIAPFFEHVKRNRRFYELFLEQARKFPIERGFELLRDNVIRPSCRRQGVTSENEIMYFFVYFQAGFTMMLKRWVDGGCAESPDELARIAARFMPDTAPG